MKETLKFNLGMVEKEKKCWLSLGYAITGDLCINPFPHNDAPWKQAF